MFELTLRDYQTESIAGLRQGIREGHKRQILCAPTGAGKSVCAAALIQEAINKASRTYFIVDRIALLDQALALFDSYGIQSGVIQAKHWKWKPYEFLQIASVGTLNRRGIDENLRLVILDECHVQSTSVNNFILAHPELIVVGLSATPLTKGLGRIYTNVVNVTTTDKLIADGWLAPMLAFACKAIDVKGLKVASDGEWDEKEVTGRSIQIVGDVVQEWKKKTNEIFGGPVKTILFSASVDHGEQLCKEFQAEGHNFVQISYRDRNDEIRREIIEEFRKPDSNITGLVSVEALSRGFDVPDIRVGVFCRPYRKSLAGWVQQLGRVLRPFPGKDKAVIIDHSGNLHRFLPDMQEFFANGIHQLDDGKHEVARKEPTQEEKEARACGACGYAPLLGTPTCPHCGAPVRKPRIVNAKPGELVEVDLHGKNGKKLEPWLQDREAVAAQIWCLAMRRKKGDHEAAVRFAKAQYRNLFGTWSPRRIDSYAPQEPHPLLVQRIRANLIRWAHSRNNPANAK